MRLRRLSEATRTKIIDDYKHSEGQDYTWTIQEIAKRNSVSISTVNNLVRSAKIHNKHRSHRKLRVPSARTMKILRDSTEPGITLEQVGIKNPRYVSGRPKPLTKQRVLQIINFWKKRGAPSIRSKGFKPGDVISWDERKFTVLRYDNSRCGAVKENSSGEVVDPFYWVYKGRRACLLSSAGEAAVAEPVPA